LSHQNFEDLITGFALELALAALSGHQLDAAVTAVAFGTGHVRLPHYHLASCNSMEIKW
jgi:hypothetical protein